MAYTDVTDGSRVIKHGEGLVKITLAADVKVGDLLGYSSGWVLADANGSVYAELVAGADGKSGELLTAYRKARVAGITTGTAGNVVYLSDTAGATSASAGTVSQKVGFELGGGEVQLEPQNLVLVRAEAVDWDDIEDCTSASVVLGNSSNRPTPTAMSGDITITNAGVTAIGSTKVLEGMIGTGAVTEAKLGTGAVTTAKIAAKSVTFAKVDDILYANDFGTPALAATDAVHAAITLADGQTTEVTTAITNPAVPRNLTVTGNAATAVGDVVIVGTDINDAALNETIVANGAATVVGAKAFKTVTSITVPARGAEGDTIAVGTGALLGLKQCLAAATQYVVTLVDRAVGATGTIAVHATTIASNTVDLSGLTYDGSKRFVALIYNT